MGLLQKIEIAQINLLNSLNGLKRLQGRAEQLLTNYFHIIKYSEVL